MTKEEKKKRIDELLLMIGGLESTILASQEQRDWDFVNSLKPMRADYYERLRRIMYGLPEKRPTSTEE
jgi:hypothetical protein